MQYNTQTNPEPHSAHPVYPSTETSGLAWIWEIVNSTYIKLTCLIFHFNKVFYFQLSALWAVKYRISKSTVKPEYIDTHFLNYSILGRRE